MISLEPCAFVGPVLRVHGVCHVPGFGLWGVTGGMRSTSLIKRILLSFMLAKGYY
ncbi:hypothetical protein SLEP1_g27613 [Rubroshorea leprosula]|uniref:Uncharacterized protein n=1 Tax=Rubroshorea leprosula TaxID=152421 RepID=A0AAV5JY21_9ROSI|nr:hypothetical protein SLEP1_g27613 [Rubroshorea leprosula]